jgi:glycosyltransferase involved in cell wall biosynthesis
MAGKKTEAFRSWRNEKTTMPKVLRIINRFNIGGPTYNVAYLSRYMAPEYETMLVGGAKDETEDSSEYILSQLGLQPVIIPEMKREINFSEDRKAYQKIKSLILDFKPDIVHTHASKAGTLGRLAAAACKVPVIVHTFHGHVFHSYFGPAKTMLYKGIERYLASKSSCVIAISEAQKNELAGIHRICPASKICVVPLGFDLNRFREEQIQKRKDFRTHYQVGADELVIMIIGRLVPIKNHKLFLEAFQHVKTNTHKKVRAFIVGDGEERESLKSMAREKGLIFSEGTNHVQDSTLTFTSWIRKADWAMAGADIIALSSLNEGTPVSLIEAQAAGKPIVSTNIGGIENVVIPGRTALLSNPGDHAAFKANMLELVENDGLRLQMSGLGWAHVESRFHYTRLVADMKRLYQQLLENSNKSIR